MAGGTIVGLDIGSSMMKVAELKKAGSGVEVTALDAAPTPAEAFDNNMLVDPQLLGQAVKALLNKAGVTAKQVVGAVSGQSAVVVRVIDVPQMDGGELAETMKWEVERHVPFAVNEVIMDYQAIERPEGYPEGSNMDVLLAVAQQDSVDRYVEMLRAAGLKPAAIDVEPLAVSRTLLELAPAGQPGHAVAVVNIGASVTEIGIYRDKLPVFLRTLPLAGDNLTRAIADMFQVDLATAENYKREYGEVMFDQFQQATPDFGFGGGGGGDVGGFLDFSAPPPAQAPAEEPVSTSGRMPFDFTASNDAPPPPTASPFDLAGEPPASEAPVGLNAAPAPAEEAGFFTPQPTGAMPAAQPQLPVPASSDPNRDTMRIQIFNAIAPVLQELAQEMRRSLDYYRAKTVDPTIHEVLVVGGTARLKNLAPFIEQELGIPTRIADPLQYVQVVAKNHSPEHLREIGSLFPVSIGLGARDLIGAPSPKKKPKPKKAAKTN